MEMKCPECGATTTSRYVCGACGRAIFIQRPTGTSSPVPSAPPAAAPPSASAGAPPAAPVADMPENAISLPEIDLDASGAEVKPAFSSPGMRPAPRPDEAVHDLEEVTPREEPSFDLEGGSFEIEGNAPERSDRPAPPREPERLPTDPDMNLPAERPPEKYVFTRVPPDAPLELAHELPAAIPPPPRDLLQSTHANELAALEKSRQVHESRRRWMGRFAILALLGVMGGIYFVGSKIYSLHVRRSWMEDPKIEGLLLLTINASPTKDTVETICSAIGSHGYEVSQEYPKVAEKDRAKYLQEAIGHWEALEDGRSAHGARPLPKDATDVMAKCRTASTKLGEAIEALGSENPPADTAAVLAAASELLALSGWGDAKEIARAPLENKAVGMDEEGFDFSGAPYSLASARYRSSALHELRADNRFLTAFADVHRLLATGSILYGATAFPEADGTLRLKSEGKVVATITENTTFQEMSAILVAEARQLLAKRTEVAMPSSIPSSHGPVLFDAALFSECSTLNQAWKSLDLALATRAAHAGVSLAFQLNDGNRTGDVVAGRAWALMAIARAYGGGFDADEALLASALGYQRAAVELTERLGEQDAVRAFIREDDATLKYAADARKATPGVRYLWARRVAETGSLAALEKFPEFSEDEDEMLQAFSALLARRGRAEHSDDAAVQAVRLEIRDLRRLGTLDPKARARIGPPSERELNGRVLQVYDNALAKVPTVMLPSPFDVTLLRSASHSRLFSALGVVVDVRLIHGVRPNRGDEMMEWLGSKGLSEEVEGFYGWVESLAHPEDEQGGGRRSRFSRYAMWGYGFGWGFGWGFGGGTTEAQAAAQLDRTHGEQDVATPQMVNAVLSLARTLDGRPGNLQLLLDRKPNVQDPLLRERLSLRVAHLRGTDEQRTEAAVFGDVMSDLEQIEKDPRMPATLRIRAIDRLVAKGKLTPEDALNHVQAMAQGDLRAGTVAPVAAWCSDHEHPAEGAALLQTWLAGHEKDQDEAAGEARRQLSRALRLQEKAEDAWAAISPAMEAGSEEVRFEGALVLLALDRKEELKKWADKLRRAGSESGDLAAAGIAWRMGNPAEAAEILKGRTNEDFWEEKAPSALADALAGRAEGDVNAAVDALAGKISRSALHLLAVGLKREKHPALAVAVMAKVPAESTADKVDMLAMQEAAGGLQAARDWMEKLPKPVDYVAIADLAFQRGEDRLVLSLPAEAREAAAVEVLWLLKAASAVRSRVKSGAEFEQIRAHYATTRSNDPRFTEGAFLVGLAKEGALLKDEKPTMDQLAAAAFCRGVAAEGAGKLDEASMHYFDSVQFHAALQYEGTWALQRLKSWRAAGKSLARIAAEGL